MPSSSLFLGSCSTLVSVLSLLSNPVRAASGTYALQKEYSGNSFFDGWDFFSDADPNKGFVTYTDRSSASRQGLVGFNGGDAFLKVDSTNTYDPSAPYYGNNGYGRPSVRIMTQQSFYHGLIIADIRHMPSGCGTWPAFWALGAAGDWPNSGEIDIIEGVNNRQNGLAALHTGGQCKVAGDARTMTGTLQNNDCFYNVQTGEGAAGCPIIDDDTRAYGAGLNRAGGGVFAVEWTSDAIKIWSFPAQNVPSDISAGTPNPSGWGLPAQTFNGPDCVIDNVIKPQKLIFNTNFCGDFGNAVWQSEGCAASTGYSNCNDYVARNPAAFADAYWQIGSVKYYQASAVTTTTTTTSSSTAVVAPTSMSSSTTESTTTTPATVIISTISQPSSVGGTLQTTSTTNNVGTTYLTTFISGTSTVLTQTVAPTLISTSSQRTSTTPGNAVDPGLISTSTRTRSPTTIYSGNAIQSGWEHWPEPSQLTNAKPAGQFYLPPMGSNVPLVPGWNNIGSGQTWSAISPAAPTSPAVVYNKGSEWSDSGKAIITTLKKIWVEPCETGYTTKTIHIVTTHCGCTETPVPTIPMKVITTDCPKEWGFKTPVVMTVPNTAAIAWSAIPAKPTGKTPSKDNGAENWPAWSSTVKVPASKALDWVDWQAYTPTTVASTWKVWSPATPVATLPSNPSGGPSWQGTSNVNIAKWQGDASKTSIGAGVLGAVVAVLAFIL